MGYTHYWNRPQVIDANTFEAIRLDFLKYFPPSKRLELHLATCTGTGSLSSLQT